MGAADQSVTTLEYPVDLGTSPALAKRADDAVSLAAPIACLLDVARDRYFVFFLVPTLDDTVGPDPGLGEPWHQEERQGTDDDLHVHQSAFVDFPPAAYFSSAVALLSAMKTMPS